MDATIYEATVSIDIRESQVAVGDYQAIAFGYQEGIRSEYLYTERDPWRFVRERQ